MLFIQVIALSQERQLFMSYFDIHEYYIENELTNAKVIGLDSKDRIYLIGKKGEDDLNIHYLKRIDKNGYLDYTYGEKGIVEIRTIFESHHPKGIILRNDKIIIEIPYSLGWTDAPKNHIHGYYYQVYKVNENGELDSKFADDGYTCKAPGRILGATENKVLFTNSDSLLITNNELEVQSDFLLGENNKLNFRVYNYSIESCNDHSGNFYVGAERRNYNRDTDTIQITKIGSDLARESSFGDEGEIYQYFNGKKSILNSIDFIDSSLYISTSVYHLAEPVVYKYSPQGKKDKSFGKDGVLQLKKAIGIKDTINGRGGIRGLMRNEFSHSLFALSIYNIHDTESSFNKYYLTELSMNGKVINNSYLGSLPNQPIQNFYLKNGIVYLPEKLKDGRTIIYKLNVEKREKLSILRNSKFDLFYNQTISKDKYILPSFNSISSYEIYTVLGRMIYQSESREDLMNFIIHLNGIYQISARVNDDTTIDQVIILK